MVTVTGTAKKTSPPPTPPTPPTANPRSAIWPQPLPIIGLTGEYRAGKTIFTLTIDPTRTLYYDTEKSGETYEALGLGFTRIDMYDEMLRLHPNGHKAIDLFQWWLDQARAIQPGRYTVIVLDTVSEIESGLCDWVNQNPSYFGHTTAQYQRMEGIFWGDVKEHWKAILAELASRCTTFAFTAHMGDIWSKESKSPTGKRKPKGKSTLMELASLYLQLERRTGPDGKEPNKPSAIVLKSRLASIIPIASGEIEWVPILPPRLPVATPHAIRQYMLSPAGTRDPNEDERVMPEQMSADDRLKIQAQIAEAQRDAEQAKLEQTQRQSEAKAAQASAPKRNTTTGTSAKRSAAISMNGQTATPITDEQIQTLVGLKTDLAITDAAWLDHLKSYNVNTGRNFTQKQAADLIVKLKRQSPSSYFANPSDQAYRPQPKLTQDQIVRLLELKSELQNHGLTFPDWRQHLAAFNVDSAKDLTEAQAGELISTLAADSVTRKGGTNAAHAASKNVQAS